MALPKIPHAQAEGRANGSFNRNGNGLITSGDLVGWSYESVDMRKTKEEKHTHRNCKNSRNSCLFFGGVFFWNELNLNTTL